MGIREIDGLWCDDITFCQEDCEDMDCPRNKHNIRDRTIPHSYSVERPADCPKESRSQDEHDMPCINCPMHPMRPTWRQGKAYCGQCGKRIPLKIKANYCHKCGREINWAP